MIGNTAMAIYSSGSGSTGTVNTSLMNRFGNYGNGKTSDEVNDQNNMQFLDIDGDATTARSTSSNLVLPEGTNTIKFARLYWGGRINNSEITSNDLNIRTIKLKGPSGSYSSFTATPTQLDQYDISSSSKVYQTYIDITGFITSLSIKTGTYTVADIAGSTGNMGSGGGYFAGWTMVVVYENTSLNYNSIRVYDGYLQVFNGGAVTTRSVTLNGLNSPSGPMAPGDAYLSVMTWEGDAGLAASSSNPLGDYLKINGSIYSDLLNPAANMWNGTISKNGVHVATKNPSYLNQFGIDLDEINVGGAYGINENQTSVVIEFGTEADQYFPSLFAFTMKMKDPQVQLDKTVTDASGNNIVERDEILTYVLDGFNLPTAPGHSFNTAVSDTLPNAVSYVPNSLKIWNYTTSSWNVVTDINGDDVAKFDSATNISGKVYYIHVNTGTGAGNANGGELIEGQHFKIMFQVKAKFGTSIINTARMIGWNQSLTVPFIDDGFAALPGSQAPLAIRLVFFNGNYNGMRSQLHWQVAAEDNTGFYEVQRSFNAIDFKSAGIIQVNGSSTSTKDYSFTDVVENAPAVVYYRLNEVGLDGKSFSSNILKLRSTINTNKMSLNGPNPFTNYIQLHATLQTQTDISVRVINQYGNILIIKHFKGQNGSNLFRIDQLDFLKSGMYVVDVHTPYENQSFEIIKQ